MHKLPACGISFVCTTVVNQRKTDCNYQDHDDVIKWKHFSRYWPFVRGIHRSPVNSPHKDQWRGALIFSLICVWINGLVNNRKAGDLRRSRAHYDVIVMLSVLVSRPMKYFHHTPPCVTHLRVQLTYNNTWFKWLYFIWNEDIQNCVSGRCIQQLKDIYCTFLPLQILVIWHSFSVFGEAIHRLPMAVGCPHHAPKLTGRSWCCKTDIWKLLSRKDAVISKKNGNSIVRAALPVSPH